MRVMLEARRIDMNASQPPEQDPKHPVIAVNDDTCSIGSTCSDPELDLDYEPISLSSTVPPSSFDALRATPDVIGTSINGNNGNDKAGEVHSVNDPYRRVCSANSADDSRPPPHPFLSRDEVLFPGLSRDYDNYTARSLSSSSLPPCQPPPARKPWHHQKMPSYNMRKRDAIEYPTTESCEGGTNAINTGNRGTSKQHQHNEFSEYNTQCCEHFHSQYVSQPHPRRPRYRSQTYPHTGKQRSYSKPTPFSPPLPLQSTRGFVDHMQNALEFHSLHNSINDNEEHFALLTCGDSRTTPVLLKAQSGISTTLLPGRNSGAPPNYRSRSLPGQPGRNISNFFQEGDSFAQDDKEAPLQDVHQGDESMLQNFLDKKRENLMPNSSSQLHLSENPILDPIEPKHRPTNSLMSTNSTKLSYGVDNKLPVRRATSDVDCGMECSLCTRASKTGYLLDTNEAQVPTVTENFDVSKDLPEISSATLNNFQEALRMSNETQAALERWDKKMGLRRSHSKTMWESDRSRHDLQGAFLHLQRPFKLRAIFPSQTQPNTQHFNSQLPLMPSEGEKGKAYEGDSIFNTLMLAPHTMFSPGA